MSESVEKQLESMVKSMQVMQESTKENQWILGLLLNKEKRPVSPKVTLRMEATPCNIRINRQNMEMTHTTTSVQFLLCQPIYISSGRIRTGLVQQQQLYQSTVLSAQQSDRKNHSRQSRSDSDRTTVAQSTLATKVEGNLYSGTFKDSQFRKGDATLCVQTRAKEKMCAESICLESLAG